MKLSKRSLSLIIVVSIVCLLLTPATGSAKIHHLTILHTNNHHGHFLKFSPWGNPDIGGMAARSTLVNIVRAEVEQAGGHVLLFSAGDVNIGPPESNLLNAEPDFTLMKMLGYDAMTLGVHEFSRPIDTLRQQREWAGFPFLSANMVRKETGRLLDFTEPYIIKEFDGLRVAIWGATTEEALIINAAEQTNNLVARNVIETAQKFVPDLRKNADLVIALTSLGFTEKETWVGSRGTTDMSLATAVPEIDVIVGGNSRQAFEQPEIIGNTLIVQAGDYGRYVGRLDLTIDSEMDTITNYTYTLIPVNLKKEIDYQGKAYYSYVDTGYVEDPAVLEVTQPYLEQVDKLLSQPIGETLVRLVSDDGKAIVRYQETNLGNLVTDGLRDKTGAEVALYNAGGIRTDLEPGPITYRDILGIHPFGNSRAVLLDMTGTQILEVLSYTATMKPGHGGFLQVSGLTWTNNRGIPEDVLVGGVPIELERVYKVVTSSFLTDGGDGYAMLEEIPCFDTGFPTTSVLREYIMKLGKVAPKVEGRITIIE